MTGETGETVIHPSPDGGRKKESLLGDSFHPTGHPNGISEQSLTAGRSQKVGPLALMLAAHYAPWFIRLVTPHEALWCRWRPAT